MGQLRLLICGQEGKMGQAIVDLLRQSPTLELVGSFAGDQDRALDADVLIDFSSPEGFRSALNWCMSQSVSFVSGTTGLSDDDLSLLDQAAQKIPVLWAPNMSLGIQWMLAALKGLDCLGKDFDFQLEEVHHKKKVDSPSGTAIALQKALCDSVKKKIPEPLSIRGGGVFGVHRLLIMGEEEVLTIEHQALNRKVFARGALVAAQWLKGKAPGRYEMSSVLGFEQ